MFRKIDLKNIAAVFLLQLVFFLLLLYVYQADILKLYGDYYRRLDNSFNAGGFIVSIMVILACVAVSLNLREASRFFANLTIVFVVSPSLVIYCGSGLPSDFMLITCSSFMVMISAAYLARAPLLEIPSFESGFLLNLLFFIMVAFILLLLMLAHQNINFDFSKVYEYRSVAEESLPPGFGYLTSICGKTVIPFTIVLSVVHRRWAFTALSVICSILLFALTGHKGPVFYPLAVLFLMWTLKFDKFLYWWLVGLIIAVLIGAVCFHLLMSTGDDYLEVLGSCLVRRPFLDPAIMNYYYLDYFSSHDHYFWSDSKTTFGLLRLPFDMNYSNMIGYTYFNNINSSANTGWIGSGYAQAGLAGCYIYSVLAGIILSVIDCFSEKLGAPLVLALFMIPVWTFITSSDLFATMLNHGLLAAFVLISVMDRNSFAGAGICRPS